MGEAPSASPLGLPSPDRPNSSHDPGHNVTLCAGLRWFSPLAFSGSLHPERREPWPLRRRAAAATSSGETVRLGDLTVSVRAPDSSAEAVGDPAPSSRSAHPRPLGIHFHIRWYSYRPKTLPSAALPLAQIIPYRGPIILAWRVWKPSYGRSLSSNRQSPETKARCGWI